MKQTFIACSISCILFSCGGNTDNAPSDETVSDYEETSSMVNYQSIPDGYGYLQDTKALESAVSDANISYIRSHAWGIWAGIMQPAEGLDWPVWYTWENTFGALAPGADMPDHQLHLKGQSLIQRNVAHTGGIVMDTLKNSLPYYAMPQEVIDAYQDSGVFTDSTNQNIRVGKRFLFNGDIMVPTESFSEAAFDWIRNDTLYMQSRLNELYDDPNVHTLDAPKEHIVTKHMYWPVLAEGVSALPVWSEDYFDPDYVGYAGYETWSNMVGIDPSGTQVGDSADVSFLYGVAQNVKHKDQPIETKNQKVLVHGLDDFYHHKITQEDWDNFDAADKAILNAASYWAHNKPIGVGDYIVTIAMHVNTKEVPTWGLQSAWWSNVPDQGKYAQDRPDLPSTTVGPWDHYLLVDSYGVVDASTGKLPIAMNPYIELVIHPMQTNCNNCHSRAGWPEGSGAGKASYQNEDCPDLLEKLTPKTACLSSYLLSDFQWTIPDHAIKN